MIKVFRASLLVYGAVLKEGREITWGCISVVHVFARGDLGPWVAGWTMCGSSQVVRNANVSGHLELCAEPEAPGCCCGTSTAFPVLERARAPIPPPPEQVDWAAAPALPLPDLPAALLQQDVVIYKAKGQQEIPTSAPRSTEEAGGAP